MADHAPHLKNPAEEDFERGRVDEFLEKLERMAAGEVDEQLPISPRHDILDAIAHGINVLAGELRWAGARAREAQEAKAAELRAAVASAEAHANAMLKAIPDLMFVLRRDGTYVDYHARDPRMLFVSPSEFMGRTVREVLPPTTAELTMEALERASRSDDPVVIEYELPMGEARFFEARVVRIDDERLLSIVREVTESKRALELNRDFARRLIARQEVERQRIARELHDDVSQRLAILLMGLNRLETLAGSDQLRAALRALSEQVGEIAADVHHVSYELHPSRLRTLGLVAALRLLCSETANQRNLEVDFTYGEIPPLLDESVSLCLYRIAQEAINNSVRHSQARELRLNLTADERQITLQIGDAGVGFDPARLMPPGLGLVSMRERVAILHGQLSVEAVPGQGTQITALVPLQPQPTS